MPLVRADEILSEAQRGGYAVGAFNANNLEYVQGIIEGAVRERAPVIIQASPGAIKYAGIDYIAAMVRTAARAPVPVVLHLDHGKDLEVVKACLDNGFTSVMYDGSTLPFEENVKFTAAVVEMARSYGIPVEGELGRVPQADREWTEEELESLMTDPEEAKEFVERTGVYSLAVAVGSVHQMRAKVARLDVERVKKIREKTGVPLVLHGSSGVSDESLVAGVKAGLCKVNIATQLNVAFTSALKAAMASSPDVVDPRKFLSAAREAVAAVVAERVRVLGCAGRA